MPLFHWVVLTLLLFQYLDLLKVFDFFSTYVKLFYEGISDSSGFISLFILLQLYFAVSFHVLGGTMDDMGNYNVKD